MASLFCYGDEEKRARLRKRGLTAQIVQWTIALRGPEWNEEPLNIDVTRKACYICVTVTKQVDRMHMERNKTGIAKDRLITH